MANDRKQQPVGREIPFSVIPGGGGGGGGRGGGGGGGGESSRAERGRRRPWTAPRLKTIRVDVGSAPINPNSVGDGITCYAPNV